MAEVYIACSNLVATSTRDLSEKMKPLDWPESKLAKKEKTGELKEHQIAVFCMRRANMRRSGLGRSCSLKRTTAAAMKS